MQLGVTLCVATNVLCFHCFSPSVSQRRVRSPANGPNTAHATTVAPVCEPGVSWATGNDAGAQLPAAANSADGVATCSRRPRCLSSGASWYDASVCARAGCVFSLCVYTRACAVLYPPRPLPPVLFGFSFSPAPPPPVFFGSSLKHATGLAMQAPAPHCFRVTSLPPPPVPIVSRIHL